MPHQVLDRKISKSKIMANPTYVILLLAAIVQLNEGFGYDATVLVGAGKKECYYQHITQPNTAVEFEYQVRN